MDEYACVSRSSLKLKSAVIKKKKKKSKDGREKQEALVSQVSEATASSTAASTTESGITLTKAEQSFLQMQEKRQTARILEKASKSHKKRVEEFNNHLDSLSEHYDIPKVSWTK